MSDENKNQADIVLSVRNVSKCFEMYEKPVHRLYQTLCAGRKRFYKEFWALKDVSFDVHRGECVGIIGRNGAGKSTLLQVITGTLAPTTGTVETHGRVAALLELGSGFNPEFTGRENVYLNGSILGLTKSEIDARYNDILAFADIGDFINQPVKTYSSGMMVRLAFAVIAHVDADILIVDEALSVGDAYFQQKCMRFMRKFMADHTVLFVSHDTGAVTSFCKRGIMLQMGHVTLDSNSKRVIYEYLKDLYSETQLVSNNKQENFEQTKAAYEHPRDMRQDVINASTLRNDIELVALEDSEGFGAGGASLVNVTFSDLNGHPLSWIVGGEYVRLEICFKVLKDIVSPIVGFHIKDSNGQALFVDNTFLTYMNKPLSVKEGSVLIATFEFMMPPIKPGDYALSVQIAEGTQLKHTQLAWKENALIFKSHSKNPWGLVGLNMVNIKMEVVHGGC